MAPPGGALVAAALCQPHDRAPSVMDPLPASDAANSMAERRPSLTYSRAALLALYDSPVLSAIPDMSRLKDWYSDYAETPASPPSHPRPSPAVHAASAGSNKARPNPFANFGRFGVDGGLEGEKPEAGKRRDSAPHMGAAGNGVPLEGKSAAGRNVRTEGGAIESKDRYGTSPTNGTIFERERGDRVRARGTGTGALEGGSSSGVTTSSAGGRERREEVPKREGRAEEGGWRSVGGPDRDRRPRQTNTRDSDRRETTSTSNNTREERSGGARSGRPAWMDDESSAPPAWMDAPASGSNSGLTFGSNASKADSGATDGADGVDGIQAWKAQMKEMERREREGPGEKPRAEPVESPSVFSALAAPKHDAPAPGEFVVPGTKEQRASVFDNLGLGTGIAASAGGGGEGGGRGSRFAKFFDGKPVAPPPAQRSAFEGLLGGMTGGGQAQGGPEPSREDRDSMARLMGMLQVSGARTVSPSSSKSPAPTLDGPLPSSQPQQSPPLASASGDTRSRQASTGGSRFAFSQPSAAQPPSQPQAQLQRPPMPQQQSTSPSLAPPPANNTSFGSPLPPPPQHQQQHLQQHQQQSFSPPPPHQRGVSSNSLGSQQGLPSPLINQSAFGGLAAAQSQAQAQAQAQSQYILAQQAQNGIAAHLLAQAQAQHLAPRGLPAGMTTRAMQQAEFNTLTQQQQQHHAMMGMNPSARPMQPQMYNPNFNGQQGPPFPSPDLLPPHLRGQQSLQPLQHNSRGPPLPPPSAYALPPGGRVPGSAPQQQLQQQPPQQLNGNFGNPQMYMPYPPQFQGRPPPPPSGSGGYGPGVPDLMSLLNAGGAGMRPPPQQQQQQQQRPAQGQDMRGYMMEDR